MFKRWWFALKEGFLLRQNIKLFLTDPDKSIYSLTEITAQRLDQQNIAILILDFDGVLANHGADKPLPAVENWLKDLSQTIGEQRIAILTNKPTLPRLQYFAKNFPCIHVVRDGRKKPYPDGILEVANYRGVPPHRVLLVDDRLMTGMLATCLAYSQGWYFRKPYSNYWRRPFKESFFSLLRILERWGFSFAR